MNPKAIFFDRDNTLIEDKGYMFNPDDLKFFPDTIEVLNHLQQQGFMLFIVTNQSGIGRGYFTEENMHEFNDHMISELLKYGINIQEIVFCPHTPNDKCMCRKPSPKLINNLCDQYSINKSLSYMVGDKQSDVDAAINAGVNPVRITPGNLKNDIFTQLK